MKLKVIHIRRSRGFLLMEALLALMIFAVFVTSLTFAIQSSSKLQQSIERKKWLNRQKKNVITEVLRLPLTESEFTESRVIKLQEFGGSALVRVYPASHMTDDGVILDQLYDVEIDLTWYKEGEKQQDKIFLKHYFPLYQ